MNQIGYVKLAAARHLEKRAAPGGPMLSRALGAVGRGLGNVLHGGGSAIAKGIMHGPATGTATLAGTALGAGALNEGLGYAGLPHFRYGEATNNIWSPQLQGRRESQQHGVLGNLAGLFKRPLQSLFGNKQISNNLNDYTQGVNGDTKITGYDPVTGRAKLNFSSNFDSSQAQPELQKALDERNRNYSMFGPGQSQSSSPEHKPGGPTYLYLDNDHPIRRSSDIH